MVHMKVRAHTRGITQSHSDSDNADFLLQTFFLQFASQRERRHETPRTIHIQPE
jgi:hypothetical protein